MHHARRRLAVSLALVVPGVIAGTAGLSSAASVPQVPILAAGAALPGEVAAMSSVALSRGTEPPSQAVLAEQAVLDAQVAALLPVATADPAYVGVWIDPDAAAIRIYVHGTPGSALTDLLRSTAGTGTHIFTTQSPYALAALAGGQQAIVANAIWKTAGINDVIRAVDGSSLEVDVQAPLPAAVQSAVTALATVPVSFVTAPQVDASTRQVDTAPFWGGDRIVGSNGESCSGGFAAHSPSGHTYLITAAHCGAVGTTWTNGNGSALVGTLAYTDLIYERGAYDASIIDTNPNGGSAGDVYDGAWNDSTGFHKRVTGTMTEVAGNYVCMSGSFSGVVCNAKVVATGQPSSCDSGYACFKDFVEQQGHLPLAGNGDSGGPVFGLDANSQDLAAATIVSITTGSPYQTSTCQGVPAGGAINRVCGWRVGVAPIGPVLHDLNLAITTG